MARYLISFDRGWMRFPVEDLPEVARAAHAVAQEAIDAGVLVFTGGIGDDDPTQVVGVDGLVTDGPYPETKEMVGGFMVVDVPVAGRGRRVGGQDRGRLPVRAGGPRVPARPVRGRVPRALSAARTT